MKNEEFIEIIDDTFDIEKILESGQFFNYSKKENYFEVVIDGNIIKIETNKNTSKIYCNQAFFDKYLITFFDMNTNYQKINENIRLKFPELKKYIDYGEGIRFLNQELLLVCITFIISQNNNVRNIKNSINKLVSKYGENGNFPSLDILKKLTIEDLKELSIGFRANYLYEFIQKIDNNWLLKMNILDENEAFEELIQFKGIGPKVANCILLFGLNKRKVFPIDVHIKRIMQKIYFENNETSNKEIESFALKKFGEYASYIQQYLFYYSLKNS